MPTWQLASDLLPDATEEQKIARCFYRNTKTNDEDVSDNEEYQPHKHHDAAVEWPDLGLRS